MFFFLSILIWNWQKLISKKVNISFFCGKKHWLQNFYFREVSKVCSERISLAWYRVTKRISRKLEFVLVLIFHSFHFNLVTRYSISTNCKWQIVRKCPADHCMCRKLNHALRNERNVSQNLFPFYETLVDSS